MQTSGNVGISEWYEKRVQFNASRTKTGIVEYTLRHRRVIDAVRFFLGHQGFKDELTFAPYRTWTMDDHPKRVYSDMASADWWWDTQEAIEYPGATVVPLIIGSDKTQVTNHQGDLSAHAVYLTVGNLPAAVRNSHERPGCILLALLPVVKEGDGAFRNKVYHECMRTLFDPVREVLQGNGIQIECADGWTRRCFPVIAAMSIDYEEQVAVTGVKSGRHCTMCDVDPDEREDLETWAPWRTHKATLAQQERQREARIDPVDSSWVHEVDCFAFGHPYVNIHKTLMVDILHQLLKGVMMHAFGWVKAVLEDKMTSEVSKRVTVSKEKSNRDGRKKGSTKAAVRDIIDKRFAIVPPYKNMRIFKHLSTVTQWTGKEQKSILRQVLPVYAPLLLEIGATDALRFLRAVVDFILLAMYKSHDDDTLRFMALALFRMNQYKEAFRPYRTPKTDGADGEGHFNFPKFHAMSHYEDMIRLLGNAVDLDSGHFESRHVEFVKVPFRLTNRKEGWESQIMEHSKRALNMRADFDIELSRAPREGAVPKRAEGIVQPTEAVDVCTFFGWPTRNFGRRGNVGRTIGEVKNLIGGPMEKHFRQAAAVFVRESRRSLSGSPSQPERDPDAVEQDDEWIRRFKVSFHASLRCWKRTGDNPDDPEQMDQDMVRCAPDWQGRKGNARYDWIWVQEYTIDHDTDTLPTAEAASSQPPLPFGGRLPAQVRYIVSIEDRTAPEVYSGAFVELYHPVTKQGLANELHGMTLIKPMPVAPWRGLLRGRRIYPLTMIYHSIHVVPVNEGEGTRSREMYINNTADFETYNMLWNPSWETDEARAACVGRAKRKAEELKRRARREERREVRMRGKGRMADGRQ